MDQPNEIIAQLYIQMFDFLLNYATASLKSRSKAEEAVQETFRIACQKPERLLSSARPEGWILNTLKNVISDMRRNQENTNRMLREYIISQSWDFSVTEDRVSVDILFEDLSQTEEMKLLKEYAIDGCSHLEMARKRGITVPACRKRLQRAREYLRKKISE